MTTTAGPESPPGIPPNRRERKKIETRAALEEAALRLFGEKGYEQTTVEEIAAAADVAVRTFFRYFSSKQHVLFGDVAHHRVNRMRAALDGRPPDERPLAAIHAVLDMLDVASAEEERQILVRLQLMERQPSLRGTYLMLTDELRQLLVDFVARRTGLPAAHPYPLLAAAAAVASWDVALTVWAASGGRRPLGDLRREAFAALTAGIPPDPPVPASPDTG